MELSINIAWVVVSSVFSAVAAYFVSKRKTETNHFKALIEANSAFREEIREDLKGCKTEVEALKNQNEKQAKEINELQKQLETCQHQIEDYEEQILSYQRTIASLEQKILYLETKLVEHGIKIQLN